MQEEQLVYKTKLFHWYRTPKSLKKILTLPGVISPFSSASVIILYPILSLTLEHGSMDSSLAATRPTHPSVTRLRYTNGVFPINSVTSLAMVSPIIPSGIDLTAKQQQSLLLLGKWRLVELEEEASGREVLYRRGGRGGP